MKQWRESNKEHVKEYWKKYYEKNCEREKRDRREYYIKNCKRDSEKNRERANQYFKNNREKVLEANRQWFINNPEKASKLRRKIENHKSKTDLKYNLNHRMKTSIGIALKGNKSGRGWETLVEYTVEDLIKRLKKTMPKGYTWQDFLDSKLHIDHIIPRSVFNYTKPEHIDFKYCWELKNLRLLPARENLIKAAKLSRPFQPALKI